MPVEFNGKIWLDENGTRYFQCEGCGGRGCADCDGKGHLGPMPT